MQCQYTDRVGNISCLTWSVGDAREDGTWMQCQYARSNRRHVISYLGRSWRSRRWNLRFESVVRFDELKTSCAPALVIEDSKPPPELLSWAATSEPLARRKMYENFMIDMLMIAQVDVDCVV